ncbi:MAG: hypothetical protein V4772_26050 [Pseudomonadota bacterium]
MTDVFQPVPPAYRGVWSRTLLETPEGIDDSTFVRWMQLGRWHADLRVPTAARADMPAWPLAELNEQQTRLLASQQGFCGTTQVSVDAAGRELCTWHRQVDYQPPRPTADTGEMVFKTPDCVIETGVHGVYREVWHRLPHSTGPLIALLADGSPSTRLLMAGHYLMRVVPKNQNGPDFEISFGRLKAGNWTIEQSTLPELEGQKLAFSLRRLDADSAQVFGDLPLLTWRVLEWEDA